MSGSQKFLSRNRAPRVQIEYDVELYGAQKKVQLPFVMGVMSDLSGKSEVPTGSVADRKFLEIDIDNFDSRMKAMKPRAAFSVPNTLSGEGNLSVDLVFEKMADFSPAAIARKVEPLRKLLEARTQLENLMAYMDGKAGAENLIERLVSNPDQLRALALGGMAQADTASVLDDVKAEAPEDAPVLAANNDAILAKMASQAPEDAAPDTRIEDTLAGMARSVDVGENEPDKTEDILAGMADTAPDEEEEPDEASGVLAGLAEEAVEDPPEDDGVEDLLAGMADAAPDEEDEPDEASGVLAGLAEEAVEDPPEDDGVGDLLAGMADTAPDEEDEPDEASGVLAGLAEEAVEDPPEDDGVDNLLAGMADTAPDEEDEPDEASGVLAGLAEEAVEDPPEDEDDISSLLGDIADTADDEKEPDAESEGILAALSQDAPEDEPKEDGVDALLGDMAESVPDQPEEDSGVDDLLADMAVQTEDSETDDDNAEDDLSALLDDMVEEGSAPVDDESGLDDLLADMAQSEPEEEGTEPDEDSVDDLLAGMVSDTGEEDSEDDLDALLGEMADDQDDSDGLDALLSSDSGDAENDLEALLDDGEDDSGLDALLSADDDEDQSDDLESLLALDDADDDLDSLLGGEESGDDLDALLADTEDDDLDNLLSDSDAEDDLEALLSDSDEEDDLEALLSGDDDLDSLIADTSPEAPEPEAAPAPSPKPKKPAFQPDFGSMSAAKLQFEPGSRRKFRMAVLGDFSGRGNKGALETGEALGKRKAFKLDFDTMEDVIARFRTTLTLPLGNDGSAVEVELNELDDLHPDELFENVDLFNELYMLRRDLNSGRNFEQNVERMKAWGGEFGDFKALSKKRSKGAEAPADMRLSEFQNLIGDTEPKPEASAASDLISRIIGPHIVTAKDNGSEAMIAVVDKALSTAMSSVLHHPDFQTIEAAWRSLELLGRRVEASAELEVVVYDLGVEEFTADLAAQDDVSQSGLYDMLVEKPMQDESAGPISAVIGLYSWEETPTHAELLARMARISAQMDAPFISAMSTGFMGIKPEDRHPLVAKTWDALGEMPEAKYLGLASPRFMLRMPYGKKTEPLDRFDYEEFNVKEGMRSMLLANPALLVAVLLAETKARQGGEMSLGTIMSLNDMPFHFMTDQYGDQVALPCTERLLSVSSAAEVVARGFMPVLSVQGQNIVKLGSFQAVGGGELLGIWSGDAAKEMKSGKARMETGVGISSKAKQVGAPAKPAAPAEGGDGGGDDDFEYGFESDLGDDDDLDLDLDLGGDDDLDLDLGGDDDGLDDLLAGFGDDDDDSDDDDDEMDADLAALLGDL